MYPPASPLIPLALAVCCCSIVYAALRWFCYQFCSLREGVSALPEGMYKEGRVPGTERAREQQKRLGLSSAWSSVIIAFTQLSFSTANLSIEGFYDIHRILQLLLF